MAVIVFDPGVSTGIAVVEDNGDIVDTWTLQEVDEIEAKARQLRAAYPDAAVVAEEPPSVGGNYRPHTQEVENTLRGVFDDIHWVLPGQWKGHPAARPDSSLRGHTQHEKDTVGLGRWFLKYRRQRSAGSTRS